MTNHDFERILICASEAGISDVFLIANKPVFWRRYGDISPLKEYIPNMEDMWRIFSKISTDDIREQYVEKLEVTFTWELDDHRYRVSATRVNGKLSLTFRTVGELSEINDNLRFLTNIKRGLIVLSSESSNGRTTLAYQLINELAKKDVVITTIEEHIEREIKGKYALVMQKEKGEDYNYTDKAIYNALNSDIIFVEQVSDIDDINAVLDVARDKLVILTVRASDTVSAIKTISRLGNTTENIELIEQKLSEVSSAFVTQKLFPCKQGGVIPCYEFTEVSNPVRMLISRGTLDTDFIENHKGMISMEQYKKRIQNDII